MKNVNLLLRNMMQASLDVSKPKASVTRLNKQIEFSYATIQAAALSKHATRFDKVQHKNEIFDADSLVPVHLKGNSENIVVKNAAKTLAKRSIKARVAK